MNAFSLQQNYKNILENIEKARSSSPFHQSICLVAVSKTKSVDQVEELYRLGQRDFGENYVQELVEKAGELRRRGCLDIRWHFIGHLQTNKVKAVLPWVHTVHSVDSVKLAQELSKRWRELLKNRTLPIFLEVNLESEKSKSGVSSAEVSKLAQEVSQFPELEVRGLMCVPAVNKNPSAQFQLLRETELRCRPITHGQLSMGMSEDYSEAILQGATHIRVGTALFGARL